MVEEVKVFRAGSSFNWSRCPLIAISKLLMVLNLPNLHGWCILIMILMHLTGLSAESELLISNAG